MTDSERAVIDAARALVPEIECAFATTGYEPSAKAGALITAVHALPRELPEQLAELRVGAVVEDEWDRQYVIRAEYTHGSVRVFLAETHGMSGGGVGFDVLPESGITRIISNPEADRG